MILYHTFKRGNLTYKLYYDEDYQTKGSYALETDEATKAAEDKEIDKLDSGEWVALICETYEPCPETHHCSSCNRLDLIDTLCGIVIENSERIVERDIPSIVGYED